MSGPLLLEAISVVLAGCRHQCPSAGAATQLLDLLPAAPSPAAALPDASALASDWGQAMASVPPSEDDLLWLGGVWLATAHRIFGADSEVTEALGLWFAAAAERALSAPD